MRVFLLLVSAACTVRADTPVWAEPTGYSPQPRFEHSADRIGNQLYVFGGTLYNDQRESDLHILNMDTMRWTLPKASGPKPLPTFGHSTAVYADQLYIMFGSNGRAMTNRVFQYDTDEMKWSRVQTHGRVPTPRAYATTVTAGNQVFSFGGYDGVAYLNDLHTWQVFDPSTNSTGFWDKVSAKGLIPEVRAGAAAAVFGRKVYMFGGFEVGLYKQDFFKLDIDTLEWSRVHLTMDSSCPMPPPRAMSTLTLVGTKLVLYGGVYCHTVPGSFEGNCTSLSDVHSYDLMRSSFESSGSSTHIAVGEKVEDPESPDHMRWLKEYKLGTTKDAPPPRYGHSATLFGSKVVVFGGANWPNLFNDMAQYDVYDRSWTMVAGRPPYSRKQHSMNMAYLGNKPHLVVFGGKHGVSPGHSSSVHTFSLDDAKWEHPAKAELTDGPDGTAHHASAVAGDSMLVVFGGYNGSTSTADVWAADLDKNVNGGKILWKLLNTSGDVPSPRHGQAVVELDEAEKGQAYTWLQWGGVNCVKDGNCTFYNELFSVSAESASVDELIYTQLLFGGNKPTPRASHTFTSVGEGKHVLYGGIGPDFSNKQDLWVFDEANVMFTQVTPKGSADDVPTVGRFGHTAVAYRNKVMMYGGAHCTSVADCTYYKDLYLIDPTTGEFVLMKVAGSAPTMRSGAASVQLGEVMYTFGGATKDRIFGDLFTMRPDKSVANNTIIVGRGAELGEAGKNVRFFAQLRDSFLKNRTTGLDKVEVTVVAADPKVHKKMVRKGALVQVAVTDMLSGSYKVDWFTNISGTYNVSVVVNGDDTFPMFQTYVQAGMPDATMSKVKGNALQGCIAGEECVFVADMYDELGNKLDRTVPLDVQLVIDPSVKIPVKDYKRPVKVVNDTGVGSINISYVANTAGVYNLEVKLRRQLLMSRPFSPVVEPAQGSTESTRAEGAALSGFVAGEAATVVVTVRDLYWNYIGRGGDNVTARFFGAAAALGRPPTATTGIEMPVEVTDNGDGTHTLTWTATVAGPYGLDLWLNGEPLKGSRIEVAPSPVSAATTFAYGTGVRFTTAGYRAYFTIQAADEFGNNVTYGGETFNVLYSGASDTAKDVAKVIDHGDGTYTVSYLTTLAGDFMLSATLKRNGIFQSIHGSPFLGVAAAGGADPTKSFVYVETVDRPVVPKQMFKVVMGVHNYFKIQAVDRYGNAKVRGNDKFTAEVQGPVSVASFISDLGDGTYIGMYVCPTAGKYFLKIYYGDQPVQNTPITIFARENMDSCPKQCSGHGECHNRECMCTAGYTGSDCSIAKFDCPGDCMGNGVCLSKKCYCYPGFTGAACDVQASKCINDCSSHGTCRDGICVCEAGFEGIDCSDNSGLCREKCNGNGMCLGTNVSLGIYECSCFPGYRGESCAERYKFCPKNCMGQGDCMTSGLCSCFPGWTGLDCAIKDTQGTKTLWTEDKPFFKRPEPSVTDAEGGPTADSTTAKLKGIDLADAVNASNMTIRPEPTPTPAYIGPANKPAYDFPASPIGANKAAQQLVQTTLDAETAPTKVDEKRLLLEEETKRRITAHKASLNPSLALMPQAPSVVPKGFPELVEEAQQEAAKEAMAQMVDEMAQRQLASVVQQS